MSRRAVRRGTGERHRLEDDQLELSLVVDGRGMDAVDEIWNLCDRSGGEKETRERGETDRGRAASF
jgi:hypothetical protein